MLCDEDRRKLQIWIFMEIVLIVYNAIQVSKGYMVVLNSVFIAFWIWRLVDNLSQLFKDNTYR